MEAQAERLRVGARLLDVCGERGEVRSGQRVEQGEVGGQLVAGVRGREVAASEVAERVLDRGGEDEGEDVGGGFLAGGGWRRGRCGAVVGGDNGTWRSAD